MESLRNYSKHGVRPKVLFLPRWYPYCEDPMFGIFIERHAKCIGKQVEIKVLFVHPVSLLSPGLHFRRENRDGIDTLGIHYNNKPYHNRFLNLISTLIYYIRAQYLGYKLLYPGSDKPDICHVHVLTKTAFLALLLHFLHGIPYIISEHWSRYQPHLKRYNGFFRRKATSLIAFHASAITAVNDHLRSAMQQCRIINPNFQLVPNVVNTDFYTYHQPQVHTQSKPLMVHISTFEDASKNISGILRTIARLAAVRNDFSFRFVGNGIDFEKMKNLADSLALSSPVVEFVGMANEELVVQHLNDAAFLVQFSNYENQPVVILESFACGRPVVATRVGGIPEMVSNERGILIDAGNEEQLAIALNSMIENYRNYNPQMLRNFAISNYSPEIVGKRFIQLYNDVLTPKQT